MIPGGPGKKPIVLCGDLMNINEWAGLNPKIARKHNISITVSRFDLTSGTVIPGGPGFV